MTIKALSLFSGGLDSLLVIKVLQKQGIKVTGICFVSNFFDAEKAKVIAKKNNFELRTVDIKTELLDLVKDPPSGHGKNLNPCVDCHSLMIKVAGSIARQEGFDIVSTGEVLGQRPFSQNKEALKRVQSLSGVDVLRPLSAKLLDETEVEKGGLVDRTKLHDIKGRSRDGQKKLLKEFGITEYPSPAGGCVLTDKGFCRRLSEMLENWPNCNKSDVDLLRYGRVIWLNFKDKKVLVVIGRHHDDNQSLQKLVKKGDFMVELKEMTGPFVVVRFKDSLLDYDNEELSVDVPKEMDITELKNNNTEKLNDIFKTIATITGFYAVKARGGKSIIQISKIKQV